ncbi:YdeI/OmpD-associated family protein [Parapedobacter sp.]
MVTFQAEIRRAENQGAAMAGWAYVEVPQVIANHIKPGYKQVYRVRGQIDNCSFAGLALMPMGGGDYYLAINGAMRRELKKSIGDVLALALEEDKGFRITMPEDLEICLLDEEEDLMGKFMALAKSHRNYFIKYITDAKTEPTRTKRIAMTVEAMILGLDFGAMIRLDKARRQQE